MFGDPGTGGCGGIGGDGGGGRGPGEGGEGGGGDGDGGLLPPLQPGFVGGQSDVMASSAMMCPTGDPDFRWQLASPPAVYVKKSHLAVVPQAVQHSVAELAATFLNADMLEPPCVHVELSHAVDKRMLAAPASGTIADTSR